MSTPQEATEFIPRGEWENTPVVIKTGGGTGTETGGEIDTTLQMQCTIGVQEAADQNYSFKSTLLENQWQSAKSEQFASITQVLIYEKGVQIKTLNAGLPGPAALQVSYGPETVIVSEVALPDSEYNKLSISSSRPFGVTDGASATDWKNSAAPVPAESPFVVFTQGGMVDTTTCASTDVEIQIMVEWGKKKK